MTKCRVPIKSISPAVHQMFMILDDMDVPLREIALQAGHSETRAHRIHRSLYDWRVGKYLPNLQSLEEVMNAVGYEIQFVKKNYETEPRAGADGQSNRPDSPSIPF